MGNKQKKNTRKRAKTDRVDYRGGGRVSKQAGGYQNRYNGDLDRGGYNRPPNGGPYDGAGSGSGQTQITSLNAKHPISEEKQERLDETANLIGQTAQGKVPEAAIIKDVSEEAGTKVRGDIKQATTTMAEPTQVTATPASPVAPEQVTTIQDTAQISQPQAIQAAQMTAACIA